MNLDKRGRSKETFLLKVINVTLLSVRARIEETESLNYVQTVA